MKHTYFEIGENDVRVLEITLRKQDGTAFAPSGAFVTIYDENENEVVAEQSAYISSNKVYTIIGTAVSATPGKYKVWWKIHYESQVYNHITWVTVFDY